MLKEKNYDKKDVSDENLIIANVRDMSRKELEQFADRMRIDRNSFLIEVQTLEDKVSELETELYFCYRNKRVEEITMGKKCCGDDSECKSLNRIKTPRNKLERYIDRYNHILELIRTLLGCATVALQLIILYRLSN